VRSHRGFLALVALLSLVATGAAVLVFYPRLPDPAVANRDQLLRWVVTRDLAGESAETRKLLARRLGEEFFHSGDEAPGWDAVAAKLSDSHRERLWSNLPLLLEGWFLERVDRYYELDDAKRSDFVDQFIEDAQRWRGADVLCSDKAAATGNMAFSERPAEYLLGQIEQWKNRAEPDQRARIDEFVGLVITRWGLFYARRLFQDWMGKLSTEDEPAKDRRGS
jgi:hypothetical protein